MNKNFTEEFVEKILKVFQYDRSYFQNWSC